MGCKQSTPDEKGIPVMGSKGASSVNEFGTGVHVGRAGNVDLSNRMLTFLGPDVVEMINHDELHRTATSLTLSNNKLYVLGKEIGLLPKLQEIEMNNNKFTRVPEALAKLTELSRVNASLNPLDSVHGFDVMPQILNLRELLLRECALTQVPTKILCCAKLQVLDLSDNHGIKLANAKLSQLTHLKSLSVANCGLKGKTLPASMRSLTKLQSLDISGNAFTFDEAPLFFGDNIPKTLKELHLRNLDLTCVPQVVATLKKCNTLDLSQNPLETLDVLAGRLVRRMPPSGSNPNLSESPASRSGLPRRGSAGVLSNNDISGAGGLGADDDCTSVNSDGRASTSSRMSMSKVSKAGVVATVSQPIPLRKLLLRDCDFRTVPKYFHKLTDLEELDLSQNDCLDDPNMTLFSLSKLRVLNITGCPFAVDPTAARNEWFDMAKLGRLRDLQWEMWRGNHNMSPYRTKVPIEICGNRLEKINEVPLRGSLFVGNTTETVINLLRDGYYKVDISLDDDTIYSYLEAAKVFHSVEVFFQPPDITVPSDAATHSPVPVAAKASAPRSTEPTGDAPLLVSGDELGMLHLHIAINRYIFFLAMQAANYDAVIIPPLDVMMVHYAHMTTSPVQYRTDCEAICGRILTCNYRTFFIQQKRHPAAAKDAVAASRKIWNLMVRSAQRDLLWLRYDFWEKRMRGAPADASAPAAGPIAGAGGSQPPSASTRQRSVGLPSGLRGTTAEELSADLDELRAIDASADLGGVLDQAITAHFAEAAADKLGDTVRRFFVVNRVLVAHEEALKTAALDTSRYIKFIALYAYRHNIRLFQRDGSTLVMEPMADADGNLFSPTAVVKRQSSVLGPHYDTLNNQSFADSSVYLPKPVEDAPATQKPAKRTSSLLGRRSLSTLSKASATPVPKTQLQVLSDMTTTPVPTIGITLILYAHRTSHVKYYQTLTLLDIENADILWEETAESFEQTQTAWTAVFEERYVAEGGGPHEFAFSQQSGLLVPGEVRGTAVNSSSKAQANGQRGSGPSLAPAAYDPKARPAAPAMTKRKKGSGKAPKKRVVLCSGDTEFGIF